MPLDSVELLRPPFSLKAHNFSIAQAENFVCHLVKKPTSFKVAKSIGKQFGTMLIESYDKEMG